MRLKTIFYYVTIILFLFCFGVAYAAPETRGFIRMPVVGLAQDRTVPLLTSTGIPFAKGQLRSGIDVTFFKENGEEIPVAVRELAFWSDGSIRSLLVQFPLVIAGRYEYVGMAWGKRRETTDLNIVEPAWEYPPAMLLVPREWLCASEVVGVQVPLGQRLFPGYDENIEKNADNIIATPWTGKVRDDLYYDLPHVLYQIYARTGDLKYFLQARKELRYYREEHVIHAGPNKGQTTEGDRTRYLFVQAMSDDYLLTGDRRSLEVAKEMIDYIEKVFPPQKAFYAKHRNNFWTEREAAFPLINYMAYYGMTGDQKYLELSRQIVENLHKTQMEWPDRGGFIHNLYAHDAEEGARRDEYGGSPFMTGLLLEGIVAYHRVTGDPQAADSIFRALAWLMNEGLGTERDALKYLTIDKERDSAGASDLNMLVVHAFAYGYLISASKEQRYLDMGIKLFEKGVNSAYLSKRKHFAQNYRSSGHFLGYLAGVNFAERSGDAPQPLPENGSPVMAYESFENSFGRFKAGGAGELALDKADLYLGKASLKMSTRSRSAEAFFNCFLMDWSIIKYSFLSFAYRVPQGADLTLKVQTAFDDWIIVARTAASEQKGSQSKEPAVFLDDNAWHEMRLNVADALKSILPGVKDLKEIRFVLTGSTQVGSPVVVHVDEFKIVTP